MDLLTEKQVSELIAEYENRVKGLIEKIKGELQNRKELKKKIEDAKQREALQLQILERMEDSEKMVRKQLELVAKMDDHESLKMLEIIKKYELMLEEQTNVWNKYKEEYESLPMVKEVRKAETRYLCTTIKYRLNLQKIKDARRKVQLKNMVRKRQEQLQIIRFAELYAEYMKKQKRCQELWDQNKKLTAQALQLRLERQEKEQAKQQKLDAELKRASARMKPQQLPQVDMSRFIIQRNKRHDKLDTMSINSYILEEEYIKNNGESSQNLSSNHIKPMDVDNEDMLMDIDTQDIDSQKRELVQSDERPRRLDFKGAFDNEGKTQCTPPERNNNEMQNHMQTASSNQSRSQVDNRTFNQQADSQDSHTDTSKSSSRKRMNEIEQQNKENTPANESSAVDEQLQKESSTHNERLVPLPVKMAKSSFQEKHPHHQISHASKRLQQEIQQHNQFQQFQKRSPQEMMQQQQSSWQSSKEMYEQQQVSRQFPQEMYQQQQVYQQRASQYSTPQKINQQNPHQQKMHLRSEQCQAPHQQIQPIQVPQNTEQMDVLEHPSNKPRIKSNESANFDLRAFQRKQTNQYQPLAESTPRTLTETSTTIKSSSPMPKTVSTSFAQQVPFALVAQSNVNVTPMTAEIEPSSMMSTSMYSGDINYLPDNISAILGSEITESGGSYELARRLHESDLNSEDGEFDIEKMMGHVCSPLMKISPKVQHPQLPEKSSTQPLVNNAINENMQNSNERAFTFGGFLKKQSNTTQCFF